MTDVRVLRGITTIAVVTPSTTVAVALLPVEITIIASITTATTTRITLETTIIVTTNTGDAVVLAVLLVARMKIATDPARNLPARLPSPPALSKSAPNKKSMSRP